MAQSSNNPMKRKRESLYEILHNQVTSLGITTVDEFFERDDSEIRNNLELVFSSLGKEFLSLPHSVLKAQLAMKHHYEHNHWDRFGSLIRVIIAEEAKSDEEIYDFINEEFNTPSSRQSSARNTVKTGTTQGLVNSSSTLQDVYPMLKRELNNLMYTDVPHLVNHFIQQHHPNSVSLLTDHIELDSLLQPYKTCINEQRREKLKTTSEEAVLNWLTPLLEDISNGLQQKISAPQHSRTWRSLRTKPIKGVDAKRMLDGAIMSQYNKDQYNIEDVLVPVELKSNRSDAPAAVCCLAKYVLEVFKAQPTRSFVVGLTLCGTWMQLWKFDRSGAIGSKPLDIKATEEKFYKFLFLITLFLTSNKQVLGFDPTFFDIDGQTHARPPQKIQISTQPNPQELVILHPIFRASGICGRGTTCWKAHLLGDKKQIFLIKDSWQPENRTPEGEMLRDVTTKDIPHVARYHYHEDVRVDSKKADIQSYVREDLEFMECQKISTCGQSDHAEDPKNSFINRVHRRLVLKDVGQPIWKVKTPDRLLEALEGCIKGHQALLNAGYLHRDISINNLMINDQAADPVRKSFLIDLDVAIPYSPPSISTNQVHPRIGTKVFMSINLLAQEHDHDFVDDLESFFWVLIWLCIHYPVDQKKKSDVTKWNQLSPTWLAIAKQHFIDRPHKLTDEFTPLYKQSEPLIACVHKFAEIMRNPHVREESTSLYDQILKLFRQAQGKPVDS